MVEYKHYRYDQDGYRRDVMVASSASDILNRIASGFMRGDLHNFKLMGTVTMSSSAGAGTLPQIMMAGAQ